MQTVYTPEIKKLFHLWRSSVPLNGLIVDVEEHADWVADMGGVQQWLNVVVYRDNMSKFSDEEKVRMHYHLDHLLKNINMLTPCYLKVEANVPRR